MSKSSRDRDGPGDDGGAGRARHCAATAPVPRTRDNLPHRRHDKLLSGWAWSRSRDPSQSYAPRIFLERLKSATSSFTRWWTVRSITRGMTDGPQNGRGRGHVMHFLIFRASFTSAEPTASTRTSGRRHCVGFTRRLARSRAAHGTPRRRRPPSTTTTPPSTLTPLRLIPNVHDRWWPPS